ncbi:hypothetical protein [Pararhizobium mangrovi]|uniref:Uncharacterized protein n=1 Tax=Pararhizobium mangrovi TaxID=2590452 RepID=A0A506TWX3_9HYPH|nr:hypothetical protein [Pararhizobium mangrovi]TPW26010.1 hypothetical protein FJU11_16475 [Pararhizobium mangrovi]
MTLNPDNPAEPFACQLSLGWDCGLFLLSPANDNSTAVSIGVAAHRLIARLNADGAVRLEGNDLRAAGRSAQRGEDRASARCWNF